MGYNQTNERAGKKKGRNLQLITFFLSVPIGLRHPKRRHQLLLCRPSNKSVLRKAKKLVTNFLIICSFVQPPSSLFSEISPVVERQVLLCAVHQLFSARLRSVRRLHLYHKQDKIKRSTSALQHAPAQCPPPPPEPQAGQN